MSKKIYSVTVRGSRPRQGYSILWSRLVNWSVVQTIEYYNPDGVQTSSLVALQCSACAFHNRFSSPRTRAVGCSIARSRRVTTHPGHKTESARSPGGVPRAAGRTPVPPRRRWVPPSALRRADVPCAPAAPDADADAAHDAIYRKVRGILNKLTPEKFRKLSDDLLALQLGSERALRGVILLIFEKALDEPKYSSMYAQLCKRLSEEAPNFEPPGQPCTFRLLLLNKCRAEFENRAQAFAAFGERALAPEDEERRHLAKCKMLGNIKFIGELGKLEILAESILHRCIQQLLTRRAAAEHHEDLECLAQLLRTVGRVLDSERGRGLMDQYFQRVDALSGAPELAPRLRFMLRDVLELRRAGWVPRAAAAADGPVPMHQLRVDDEPRRERERGGDALFRGGLRARPLDDVLAGLALQQPPQHDKLFGNGFAPRDFRQRSAPGHFPRHGHGTARQAPPPPRKAARAPPSTGLQDVQMRPPSNALLFTATRLSRAAAPPPPPPALLPAPPAKPPLPLPLLKEPAITIKPAPDKRDKKDKKDKALNKEEACRLAIEAVTAIAARGATPPEPEGCGPDEPDEPDDEPALRRLRELQLPDKLLRRVVGAVLEHALAAELPDGGAGDAQEAHEAHEARVDALADAAVRVVRGVRRAAAGEALRALAGRAPPAPAARLAALLGAAARRGLLPLGELGAWCEGGAHGPLLLDALVALRRQAGEARAVALVARSSLDVCAHVAEREAGAAAALEALEARGLGALAPQLRARAALARQLAADPAPAALYRWIRANVDAAARAERGFVSGAVLLVLQHVWRAAGGAPERERALAEEYAPLLRALLEGRAELQLCAVYAVQLLAHQLRYPKGLLLRWFMYLYNLEVCEEDAFLRWREDVTDAYPGKGEALFQVNTWLTWLQQQESEDEEAED